MCALDRRRLKEFNVDLRWLWCPETDWTRDDKGSVPDFTSGDLDHFILDVPFSGGAGADAFTTSNAHRISAEIE